MPRAADHSPPWFTQAVFYELPVKSFFDASGDGVGDFAGLTQKLDYIADLGATCVWLLPFYPSPLKDDGYDVTDYRAVHPAYGTLDDFRCFVREAHNRGLRIAAEMVINHTSDQHPWFQAARNAPAGSPLREFYVWSNSPQEFREAESRSNWTWDDAAQAFYWHRFDSHQPDLNYDNPQVRDEVLKILRFWADLGIDGLCLNGAAYLVEREGSCCEHLPETHDVLRWLRSELAAEHPEVVIQGGMNAWPADAVTYFGDGDECHLAPNLALAQRMFLALRQENRQPIEDILRQTPIPPDGCQWVTLLRNHDELTLSLATDEERDYLFREYAADASARLNAGILRRLAPLMDNSRRRIELLYGLLFSLPGAPVIYYGDEIGMGDNTFAGGRNAVRTPMQWTADRNAGFSSADFARLYCPPVMDPLYGYQAVNVEAQRRDSSSLLHWMRRLIAMRKQHRALADGTLEPLEPRNQQIIAFVRRPKDAEGDPILVVANLSRSAQPAELDLSKFAGLIPVEMFGREAFPRIGPSAYLVTLAPHSFLWFELQKTAEPVATRLVPVATEEVAVVPEIRLSGKGDDLFDKRQARVREELERHVFPGFLRSQRWFGGKARRIESVQIADWSRLPVESVAAYALLLDVHFVDGTRDTYFVPVATSDGAEAARLYHEMRHWVIARLSGPAGDGVLYDALASDAFCTWLLAAIGERHETTTNKGQIRTITAEPYPQLRGNRDYPLPVVRGPATSSNSLVFYGRRLLLKLFRRLEPGVNPDFEVGRYLGDQQHFPRIPRMAGALEYRPTGGKEPYTLAVLQALVSNQGDGWAHAIDELSRYFDRASGRMGGPDKLSVQRLPLASLAKAVPPPAALETIASYLHAAATLGRRTAEMHLALAKDEQNAAFGPEPLTTHDMAQLSREIASQGERALAAMSENLNRLPADIAAKALQLLRDGPKRLHRLTSEQLDPPQAAKTRIHGDYHLGQVLWVENDYIILDFEGEPTRTVEERRAKYSPIRDVAGMLRSYHYAAYAGLFAFTQDRPADLAPLIPWADLWHQWTSATFLQHYLRSANGAAFVPQDPQEFARLLDSFILAKSLYELVYELNNRPDWVRIPLMGVLELLLPSDAATSDTTKST